MTDSDRTGVGFKLKGGSDEELALALTKLVQDAAFDGVPLDIARFEITRDDEGIGVMLRWPKDYHEYQKVMREVRETAREEMRAQA